MPAGPMGSHNCDTPNSLMHSAIRAINAQNPQFSIFTGDVIEGRFGLASSVPLLGC